MNDKETLAAYIKGGLILDLEKQGQSLDILEHALSDKDFATQVKTAGFDFSKLLPMAWSGLKAYGGAAAAAGALGGFAGYGAYQGLKDSDAKLREADAIKQRIDNARAELEAKILDHKIKMQQQEMI